MVTLRLTMETSRAPPGTGTGLNNTALMSVNTIVLRPIPNPRVATTAAENHQWERIIRSAKRRSFLMRPSYGETNDLVPPLTRNSERVGIESDFRRDTSPAYSIQGMFGGRTKAHRRAFPSESRLPQTQCSAHPCDRALPISDMPFPRPLPLACSLILAH